MPKSKKRKGRYIPRPKPQQQTMTATTQAGEAPAPVAVPRPSAPAAKVAPAPVRSGPPASKVSAMPQVDVSSELRVIGILTVALLALIIVLFFALR